MKLKILHTKMQSHSENTVKDLKVKKCNLIFVVIFWLLTLTISSIFAFEFFYIQKPKSERCVIPYHDLKDNSPEDERCVIYTHCEFKQNGTEIDGDPKYYLHSDQVLLLPDDYQVKDQLGYCPNYWELPGYKNRLDGLCDDEGFGCCVPPFDVKCNQIIHYHKNDMSYSGFLYDKIKDPKPHFLDIPKSDAQGSNCPTIEEIICESFHSTQFLCLPYIIPPWFVSIIIIIFLSCKSDTVKCIYEKQAYIHVQGSV